MIYFTLICLLLIHNMLCIIYLIVHSFNVICYIYLKSLLILLVDYKGKDFTQVSALCVYHMRVYYVYDIHYMPFVRAFLHTIIYNLFII